MDVWWLSLIYVIPSTLSLPVYAIFFLALLRYRRKSPLDGAFFFICRALALPDMVNLCISLWITMGQLLSIDFGWRSVTTPLAVGLTWHSQFAQHLGTLTMAANRLSSVLLKRKHEYVWDKLAIPSVVLVYALPLAQSIPFFLFTRYTVVPVGRDPTTNITIFEPRLVQLKYVLAFNLIVPLVAILLCPIMYLITFVKLTQLRWKTSGASGQDFKRISGEIRLTFCATIIFLVLCLLVAAYINFFLRYSSEPENVQGLLVARVLMFGAGSLYSFINPYAVLFCSAAARDSVRQLFRRRHNTNSVAIFIKRTSH